MAVAKARGAPELVAHVDVKVSHFAPVTPLTLDVGLAQAVARVGVTAGGVVQAALWQAPARLTAQVAKVPVVGRAGVAFVAGHPVLALAGTRLVALLVPRTWSKSMEQVVEVLHGFLL